MSSQGTLPRNPIDTRRAWWSKSGPTEELRAALSRVYEMTPLNLDSNSGLYRSNRWVGDNCVMAMHESDASIMRRTKVQGENCGDDVFVHRLLAGQVRGAMGNRNLDKDIGTVYLTDQALDLEVIQFDLFAQGVRIPKKLIGYQTGVHDAIMRFPGQRIFGKLLNQELDRIFSGLVQDDVYEPAALTRLIDCVKAAISTDPNEVDIRRHARESLTTLICTFIEENLTSPDLSADTLLKTFGVSRASLYRMMEDKGGVRQYISDRRLQRAIVELSQSAERRGAIAHVAEKWLFPSGSSFNRSVRRKFGVTPGELIRFAHDTPEIMVAAANPAGVLERA